MATTLRRRAGAVAISVALVFTFTSSLAGESPSLPRAASAVTAPISSAITMHPKAAPTATAITETLQQWLASRAARCVEFNESTDGKYSPNLWQLYVGYRLGMTAAEQDAAAYALWRARGWEPWLADRRVCHLW